MCDEVLFYILRVVYASLVRMLMIIWIVLKLSMKL